ncbi:MAG: dTMP kinase [Bacteroidota bacterium]
MPSSFKPLFIVFEGLDGSGKTTQMEMLAEHLRKNGHDVHLTAEPTDFLSTGQLIRDVLQGKHAFDARTLAALFAADRIQHLTNPKTGVLDRLSSGQTVISSRYYFSSLAYQAETGALDWVAALNSQARALKRADITFFLDLSAEASMKRISSNRDESELFETEERLDKARQAFERAFEYWKEGEHVVRIDASEEIEDVFEKIVESLPAGDSSSEASSGASSSEV